MNFRRLLTTGIVIFGSMLSPAFSDVKIAIAGPMEGQFEAFGAQMVAGAAQAVSEINAAGGVNGQTILLDVVDDGCEGEKATAVANQLVGKNVVFVAGHFCFGASIAASKVYADEGILQISPATTLPKYTDERPGPGIFRLAPRDDEQAKVAGQMLALNYSGSRIAFLHDKTAFGKGLVDAVKEEMRKLGAVDSVTLGFDSGAESYRGFVSQLSLQNIGVVYLGGYHREAALIKQELAYWKIDAVLISGDALMTNEYWLVAGAAGEGTLLTYPEIPRQREEAAKAVLSLEEAGFSADRYALTTYAAVKLWAEAARRAGSVSANAVTAVLETDTFDTILGSISFDENGDSGVPSYVWYQWQDGVPVRWQQ